MIQIEIETGNDAFVGTKGNFELGRILRDVALRVENTDLSRKSITPILDCNGNACGYVDVTPDE